MNKLILMKPNGEIDVAGSLELQQKLAQLSPPSLVVDGLKPLGNGIYEIEGEIRLLKS